MVERPPERLPERLVLYDKADQKIGEQFVDDERNIRLQARIRQLRKKYGTGPNDVPFTELAKLVKEFGIHNKFLGVAIRKGRAKLVQFTDEMDVAGYEDAPPPERWFRVETEEEQVDYIYLGKHDLRETSGVLCAYRPAGGEHHRNST